MKGKQFITALLVLLATAGAIAGQTPEGSEPKQRDASTEPVPGNGATSSGSHYSVRRDYVIGPEDVLAIDVWKEPEISRTVPVRPDGKISLPLLGDMVANGLTADQLQASIKKGLQGFVSSPEVTVIVQEIKSAKINVVGQVVKPGSYPLSKPMTVLDALVMAGGFRDFAKVKKIYVLRVNSDGTPNRMAFNYKEVIKGNKLSQNVALEPHDTIVVP